MSSAERAVFRLPWVALAIPLLLLLVTIPLATAERFLNVLFLLPIGALFYVVWSRTVVDGQYLTVYSLRGRRRLPWAELDGLEFHGSRWAIAVTMSGSRFRLPMIRPRDLPRLAAVSGGRLLLGEDAPSPVETLPEPDVTPEAVAGSEPVATTARMPDDQVLLDKGALDNGVLGNGVLGTAPTFPSDRGSNPGQDEGPTSTARPRG